MWTPPRALAAVAERGVGGFSESENAVRVVPKHVFSDPEANADRAVKCVCAPRAGGGTIAASAPPVQFAAAP